jgi:hypothetical protein
MSDTNRAVQALIDDSWLGEWERPIDGHDLKGAVAIVTRVIRDDLYMAWQAGEINDLAGAEWFLNRQIEALVPGRRALTGDTTEGMSA